MSHFKTNVKRYFNNRFSGKINKDIESTKEALKIINSCPLIDGFWASWYVDYRKAKFSDDLEVLQKARFIPGRFIRKEKDYLQNSIEKITQGDRLVLKNITLPRPEKHNDLMILMDMLCDSLLPYLLDDIDEELLHSLITPTMEGPYEYKSVQLEKGDIVIDAGANIGEFSALAGVKGCRAYAFEPMPNIIDTYLSKTAQWNPNITICQYALSDKRGELVFVEDTINMAASSFVLKKSGNRQIKVQAIDLDTFVEENKLPSVDFIKADIEGAERYMLMGAKRVLKEFAPKIAICTYHLPDDPKVLRELILDANPNYIIEEKFKKMYAYVRKEN